MQSVEQLLAFHAFVGTHRADDAIERADTQRIMIGHREPLMRRRVGLQNDVAAFLVHDAVTPIAAEGFDQLRTTQVARDFHAPARTSSRTRRSRMRGTV
jgi:hypothetical protein